MRKKIPALMLMMITVIVPTLIVPTKGKNTQNVGIEFEAFANGECVIVRGGLSGTGFPDPRAWGYGTGKVSITGHADDIDPLEYQNYHSANIETNSKVSIKWKEEDGSKHKIKAVLYSTYSTEGMFNPDEDHFAMPNPQIWETGEGLMFEGVHQSGSKNKEISGEVTFISGLYGPIPGDILEIIIILMVDESSEKVYMAAWSHEEVEIGIPIPGNPTLVTLFPANVYKTEVEIKN